MRTWTLSSSRVVIPSLSKMRWMYCCQRAGVRVPQSLSADLITPARWQQYIQRILLKQRITTREENYVQVRMLHRVETDCSLIDTEPKCLNCACDAQLLQRAKATAVGQLAKGHIVAIAVGQLANVVDIQDVDTGHAEPLSACLPRSHHSIKGIVKFGFERHGRIKSIPLGASVNVHVGLQ